MQRKQRTKTTTTMATWLLTCAFALPVSVVAAQIADDGAVALQRADGEGFADQGSGRGHE